MTAVAVRGSAVPLMLALMNVFREGGGLLHTLG